MDPEHWQRVETVLDAVLARDRTEWPRLLEESCGADLELRREVEALLSQESRADGFLDTPPGAVAAALMEGVAPADLSGRRVGAFRLVRSIGRGGMSHVYLADRADGLFEQRVAVKLLRADLDSPIDLARFAAERRILASLSHPSIARLLDGGVTEDGRPYLVLEYVDGKPIDCYCDERGLGPADRLALFGTVADATAYAHRNLVVHRDLKPSNILVTADGDVKLLDFGLAKLLEGDGSHDHAPATRTGHRWMTPEYAAPEQVLGQAITTVTDVYQLGVVLYELLTGRLPFAGKDSVHEIGAAVLSDDPPVPSSLRPGLTDDLDAIVLQAMHKAPERRYPSAEALRDDLRRLQEGRPVRARRDTAGYRLRRFVGRNQVAVAAAAAAVLALLAATVFSITQMREARRQRDLATEDARRATAMSEVLSVLAGEPSVTGGRVPTAVERVELAEQVLRGRYEKHPAVVVEVMATIAGRLYDLPDLPAERRVLGRARELAAAGGLPAQLALVTCMRATSYLYDDLIDSALADLVEARASLRVERPRPEAEVECASAEGRRLLFEGHSAAAVAVLRRAVAAAERAPGQLVRLQARNLLAEALRADGRTREAAEHHLRILREMDSTGYTHSDLLENVLSWVSAAMGELGEFAVLDSIMRDLVPRQERLRAPGVTGTLVAFVHGLTQLRMGELDSADLWLGRALADGRDTGRFAAWAPATIALLRLEQGRARAARVAVGRLPEGTPTRLLNRAMYGAWLRRAEGDTGRGEAMLDSALRVHAPALRPPPYATTALLVAAEWRLARGVAREADSLARLGRAAAAGDTLALRRSAHVARAEMVIARARRAMGDTAGALEAASRAAIASAAGNGPVSPRTRAAAALKDSLGLSRGGGRLSR